MKKIYQYEYDNYLKEIEKLEDELADTRLYKGQVAIFQGDNWHDNPILYQTELKETALMAKIRQLKENLHSYEIIKERDNSMVNVNDILNPNLVKEVDISEEKKSIIKAKQNYIIKFPIDRKLFVDLKPGTGYENILLYRIAYLLCSSNHKLDEKEILSLNPNDEYSELLSHKLSSFITEDINHKTILELGNEYTKEKFSLSTNKDKNFNFKTSMRYKELLDNFINYYMEFGIISEDLMICEEVLFNKDEIREALYSNLGSLPNYDWASGYFINKYKTYNDKLCDKLVEKYANIYRKLPFDDPTRAEYVKKANEIKSTFKKDGIKIIKNYFKKLNRKYLEIYAMFINNLENIIEFSDSELLNFKLDNLNSIKKKKITIEDINALIYIKSRLTNEKIEKKQIIINELQNYGEFIVYTLENVFSNSGFTLFRRDDNFELNLEDFEAIELSDTYESDVDSFASISKTVIKKKQLKNR